MDDDNHLHISLHFQLTILYGQLTPSKRRQKFVFYLEHFEGNIYKIARGLAILGAVDTCISLLGIVSMS
jgi:hypothetical protein